MSMLEIDNQFETLIKSKLKEFCQVNCIDLVAKQELLTKEQTAHITDFTSDFIEFLWINRQ